MAVYRSVHVHQHIDHLRRLIAVHYLDANTDLCHACKASCPCDTANDAFNQLTAMRVPATPPPKPAPRARAPLLTRVWTIPGAPTRRNAAGHHTSTKNPYRNSQGTTPCRSTPRNTPTGFSTK
jgi:hypothetical protein